MAERVFLTSPKDSAWLGESDLHKIQSVGSYSLLHILNLLHDCDKRENSLKLPTDSTSSHPVTKLFFSPHLPTGIVQRWCSTKSLVNLPFSAWTETLNRRWTWPCTIEQLVSRAPAVQLCIEIALLPWKIHVTLTMYLTPFPSHCPSVNASHTTVKTNWPRSPPCARLPRTARSLGVCGAKEGKRTAEMKEITFNRKRERERERERERTRTTIFKNEVPKLDKTSWSSSRLSLCKNLFFSSSVGWGTALTMCCWKKFTNSKTSNAPRFYTLKIVTGTSFFTYFLRWFSQARVSKWMEVVG